MFVIVYPARSMKVTLPFSILAMDMFVFAIAAIGNIGLELRSEGLIDRRPLATLRVPWEAMAVGAPLVPRSSYDTALTLTYARRGLVRGRANPGHLGGRVNVNAYFLSHAITQYVEHPEVRAAIGTQAGYDELRLAIAARSASPPRENSDG